MILNPKKAIFLNSISLVVIGLTSYFLKLSITALIPVIFGVLLFIGYMVYEKNPRLIAHISIALILIVFLSLFMPLNKRIEAQDFYGILRVGLMQLASLYSIFCFTISFIRARKS